MKAQRLLGENVSALLKMKGLKQTDLAQWCKKSDVWVSQFLNGIRNWQLDDLDRVADLFGIATYQLFQPGISRSTERRHENRREGHERRVSYAHRVMLQTAAEIDRARPPATGKGRHAEETPVVATDPLHRLIAKFVRDFGQLQTQANAGRQTPVAQRAQPKPRALRRAAGGSDDSGSPTKSVKE